MQRASDGDRRWEWGERKGTTATLDIWRNREIPAHTGQPIWRKEDRGERYQSLFQLHRIETGLLLKIDCEGRGAFEYRPQGIGIHWEENGTGPAHYFQTWGLAIWLELHGIPCIHANGLAIGDRAIGLIAPSRTGKTTLTAALLESGLQMMSDDMMALHPGEGEWRIHPGWPQFRMWPDTARRYAGQPPERLERVHERFEKRIVDLTAQDRFQVCTGSRPLQRLYLLERRDAETGDIEIEEIPPGEALLHLLQNSMLADAYQALGMEQERLGALADLSNRIGLMKVSYPRGLHHLPAVCERLKRHSRGG